jgi:hypothetical protein
VTPLVAKARKLLHFAVGQGAVQAFGLLNGFLLLRWLSVEQYAIYTVVNGFSGTVAVLVEMQLATSLMGLLAGRTDPRTVGGYIRSVRHYRNWSLGIATPFICVAFALLAMRQGWSAGLTVILLVLIVGTAFFTSWTNYYSVPFIIRHDMFRLYRVSAGFAALRLAGSYFLWLGGAIGAVAVAVLAAFATAATGWVYRKQAARLIEEPEISEQLKNQEVLGFVRPLIPTILFFAFQGQIGVLLIAWFGQAQAIADIGALGRISQIFLMLGAFNSVLLAPYIAKTPRSALLSRYLCVILATVVFSVLLILSAFYMPQLYMWLVGPKYAHLASYLWLLLTNSSIGYITGVLWTMTSARKWIFGWGAWLYITVVLLVQIVCLQFMAVNTVNGVLLFSILTSTAMCAVNAIWAFAGFRKEKR